jgi:hypothetical protein
MMPAALIVHEMQGRIRLRVPEMRGEPEFFSQIENRLQEFDDIFSVTVRPMTGSILIEHDGINADELAHWARNNDLFDVKSQPGKKHAGYSIAQMSQHELNKLDEYLKRSTEERFDLLSLLMLMAIGLIISEFLKGRLSAGSFALVWYALDAAGISTIKKKEGF